MDNRPSQSVSPDQMASAKALSELVKDFRGMKEIRVLGQGAYGTVTLVEDPATRGLIALKSFNQQVSANQDLSDTFFQEVASLVRLTHPCVIPIVGFSLPRPRFPAQIATRFAANGSLRDALNKRHSGSPPTFMDDTGIAIIVAGIVIGMEFMHSQGVIHRDVKPENILIDELGHVKIGDFGSSRFNDLGLTLTAQVGTPLYMAPEMYEVCEYTTAVDVYSFALILYELLTGNSAFPGPMTGPALMNMVLKGTRPELPQSIPLIVRKIIGRGWLVNPELRDSFEDIFYFLNRIDFKLTPAVDPARVRDYVKVVRRTEPAVRPADPAAFFRSLIRAHSNYVVDEITAGREGSWATFRVATDKATSEQVVLETWAGDFSRLAERLYPLRKFSIPFVVDSLGIALPKALLVADGRPVGMASTYYPNGTLEAVLRGVRKGQADPFVGPTELSKVIFGVAFTMSQVHSRHVIHRDLTPENVFFDANYEPIVGGFDLARIVGLDMTIGVASPLYMAPELYDGSGDYGPSVDVYAFAVFMYSIFKAPQRLNDDHSSFRSRQDLMMRVLRGARFVKVTEIPDAFWRLIQSCWAPKPNERPTFESVVGQLKSDDKLVFPETDLGRYHDYQARRMGEVLGPGVGEQAESALAAAVGWTEREET